MTNFSGRPPFGLNATGAVYLAVDGGSVTVPTTAHQVPDVETFNQMGLSTADVVWVDALGWPVGSPFESVHIFDTPNDLGFRIGLVGDNVSGAIYISEGGYWHWIPDSATFNALGLGWGNVTWYNLVPWPIGANATAQSAGGSGPQVSEPYQPATTGPTGDEDQGVTYTTLIEGKAKLTPTQQVSNSWNGLAGYFANERFNINNAIVNASATMTDQVKAS